MARTVKLGYRDREVKVDVDPRRLERYQVSLGEIIQAIIARNIRLSGGTFESYTSEHNILTLAQFSRPEEVGEMIVRSSFEGPLITVKDLAVIRTVQGVRRLVAEERVRRLAAEEGARSLAGSRPPGAEGGRQGGRPGGGSDQSTAQTGSTPAELLERILRPFRPAETVDELPFGPATVHFSEDVSKYVENSLRIVLNNGLIGLVLVILMLTVFLNSRSAFWVALGIPVSAMGVFFLLPLFDSFLDTVTLTVLVIVMGIVVDDGIIISENIDARMQRGEPPLDAAVNGTAQLFFPVLTTVLTTVVAFLPLFWMEGSVGKVVHVVPLTIALAVSVSLLEAVVALPAHLCAGARRAAGASRMLRRTGVRRWFDHLRGNEEQRVDRRGPHAVLRADAERAVFNVDTGGPPVGRAILLRVVGHDDLGKEQIKIVIDYRRLARLGLTAADVARNVRIAYDGEVVTSIRQEDEDVDFRVQFTAEARQNLEYLRRMTIPNSRGRLIPLSAVARLETAPGLNAYRHSRGRRVTTITADVDQEVTTSLEATRAVLDRFDLGRDWPGLQWEVGGEAEESTRSIVNLATSFVLAVLGIYFLLVLLFESFTQPLIVLVAVPFGVVGVIFALVAHGQQAGFLALMGSVGLAGIVVNDSLVLVSHINELRKAVPERSVADIVAEGTANRLRAILLTTLTTVVGLLPLAYGIGGMDLYMSPMALTMGYGLLFATPLTLILVPCLYTVGGDLARLRRRILPGRP